MKIVVKYKVNNFCFEGIYADVESITADSSKAEFIKFISVLPEEKENEYNQLADCVLGTVKTYLTPIIEGYRFSVKSFFSQFSPIMTVGIYTDDSGLMVLDDFDNIVSCDIYDKDENLVEQLDLDAVRFKVSASYRVEDFDTSILIESLELSVRAYNCLKRAGYTTVKSVLEATPEDLCEVRNLGRKGFLSLFEPLSKAGYTDKVNELVAYASSMDEQIDRG